MKRFKQLTLALVFILMAGCANRDEVVFARIDDFTLTADFIKEQVLVDARLSELSRRPIPLTKFNHWANGRAMKILGEWVSRIAIDLELNSRGVEVTPEARSRCVAEFVRPARIKYQDENEVYDQFGELKDAVRRRIDMAARMEAFVESHPAYRAEDDEIGRHVTMISNRIEAAERINVRARESGRRAWSRLSDGGDWEQIAREFSQDTEIDDAHKDFWRKWFDEESINVVPPEVASALKDQPEGFVTPPIETDEGLLIVKLFKREGEYVTLGRILFLMGEQLELPNRKMAERQILMKKRAQILKSLAQETFAHHKFVYPMGSKFHYEIWKEEGGKNARTNRHHTARRNMAQ